MILEHSIRRFKSSKRWLILKIAMLSFLMIILIGSVTLYLLAEQTVNVYEGGAYPENSIIINGVTSNEFINSTRKGIVGMEDFVPVETIGNSTYTLECNGFEISSYAKILGVEPRYFSMFSIKIKSGKTMGKSGEIVMGNHIFNHLKDTVPGFDIGSKIKIKNPKNNVTLSLKVVGILMQQKPVVSNGFAPENSIDNTIFLSTEDFHRIFGNATIEEILIKSQKNMGLIVYYQLKSKFRDVDYPGLVKFRNTVALSWLEYFLTILNLSAILSVSMAIFAAAVSQIRYSHTEFGVLKASGVSPTKIFIILLLETVYVFGIATIISFVLGGIFVFTMVSLLNLGASIQEVILNTILFPLSLVFLIVLIYPAYGVIHYSRLNASRLLRAI